MENFDTQIIDLIGSFSDQSALDDFMTAGCKEIINSLPPQLLLKCADISTLNNSTTTLTNLDTKGLVLDVLRYDGTIDHPCRLVPVYKRGRIQDASDMEAASTTDPAYLIFDNTLEVYPTPTAGNTAKVHHVIYPTVDASAVSTIANFPDEAEHLVVLYSSIKALQQLMSAKLNNSDITTALTAVNTELNETQAICDAINTQVDSAVTELAESAINVDNSIDTATAAITTALGRVNTAVALANVEFDLVNPEIDLANAKVDDDDIEVASGYLSTAQGYSSAGSNYIAEAQASLSEAQGFASEVAARSGQVSSQVAVAQGYISAAQGYANEIQTKIAIASAYSNQVQLRLSVDSTEYTWYERQQAKLQQDYDKGLAQLVN
jgi:hypothetical protein